jgi:hypothetical protein
MILMAIVALVLTLGMPKLMENSTCFYPQFLTYSLFSTSRKSHTISVPLTNHPALLFTVDPEMRAEFEQQSRASPITGATTNAMTGGGFDLAGWMAGTAPNPMTSAEGATGRETTTGSARKRG